MDSVKQQNIQRAINCMQKMHHWNEKMILPAMELSLEGEKRRNRYFANKLHKEVLHAICKVFDFYGLKMWYQEEDVADRMFNSDKEYFEASLKGYEFYYNEFHAIANALVVANAKEAASGLYDLCCEISKDCIVPLRRFLLRKQVVADGKGNHDTLIYETSWADDANVHDSYEKKE